MRALVIDDSRVMRMMLKGVLQQAGFECLEAANGRDALAMLRGNPDVSVALVDWHMPEMDGCEFVQALRADTQMTQIPVLMVSSESDMASAAHALESGVSDYLMKPFTRESVVAKLQVIGILPSAE